MENENKGKNVMVETYSDDMAKVLESDSGALIKNIIHGAEEQEKEKQKMSPESLRNKFFMIAGIILIALAAATLYYFLVIQKNVVKTVPIAAQFVPIIFNDKTDLIEVSGLKKDDIVQNIAKEINATSVKVGGLEGIYLTESKQMIGLRHFLAITGIHLMPSDNPIFVSDKFLLGVVNNDNLTTGETNKSFFILLKTRSIPDIFDSMHDWEKNMFTDLQSYLNIAPGTDTSYFLTKSFEDGIVENKNARMLYDKDGNLVLAYIYADDQSVVVTDSLSAAHEIMQRLAGGQKTQ